VRVVQSTYASLTDAKLALTYQRDGTITMVSADGAILQKLGPASPRDPDLQSIPPTWSTPSSLLRISVFMSVGVDPEVLVEQFGLTCASETW
jgi:hypothetical protein